MFAIIVTFYEHGHPLAIAGNLLPLYPSSMLFYEHGQVDTKYKRKPLKNQLSNIITTTFFML
jgi:hypothetical protein